MLVLAPAELGETIRRLPKQGDGLILLTLRAAQDGSCFPECGVPWSARPHAGELFGLGETAAAGVQLTRQCVTPRCGDLITHRARRTDAPTGQSSVGSLDDVDRLRRRTGCLSEHPVQAYNQVWLKPRGRGGRQSATGCPSGLLGPILREVNLSQSLQCHDLAGPGPGPPVQLERRLEQAARVAEFTGEQYRFAQ